MLLYTLFWSDLWNRPSILLLSMKTHNAVVNNQMIQAELALASSDRFNSSGDLLRLIIEQSNQPWIHWASKIGWRYQRPSQYSESFATKGVYICATLTTYASPIATSICSQATWAQLEDTAGNISTSVIPRTSLIVFNILLFYVTPSYNLKYLVAWLGRWLHVVSKTFSWVSMQGSSHCKNKRLFRQPNVKAEAILSALSIVQEMSFRVGWIFENAVVSYYHSQDAPYLSWD